MTAITTQRTGRSLVSEQLFHQIAQRVVDHNNGIDLPTAQRATDQALAFLAVLAVLAQRRDLYPSQLVDKGWHAFLLDTPAYTEWCDQMAGGFIHHVPHNTPDAGRPTDTSAAMQAVTAAGFVVDEQAWNYPANCGNSGCGGGPPPT